MAVGDPACRSPRRSCPTSEHYDLVENGRPLHILIVGMEMGTDEERVSLERRTEQIQVSVGLTLNRRNPHMRGVTHALRLILGRAPGTDRIGELLDLDPPTHVFNACATTNVRLCSAYADNRKSKGTPLMTRRCLRHLAETIRILEPTVVVTQSTRIDLSPVVERREKLRPHLSRVDVRGTRTLLAEFSHPTAQGDLRWGGLTTVPYLYETVVPVLQDARRQLLA